MRPKRSCTCSKIGSSGAGRHALNDSQGRGSDDHHGHRFALALPPARWPAGATAGLPSSADRRPRLAADKPPRKTISDGRFLFPLTLLGKPAVAPDTRRGSDDHHGDRFALAVSRPGRAEGCQYAERDPPAALEVASAESPAEEELQSTAAPAGVTPMGIPAEEAKQPEEGLPPTATPVKNHRPPSAMAWLAN